jgi:hypothetical protein
MNRITRKICQRLPTAMRQHVMRRLVRISGEVASQFTFDIARTREDLEAAFKILHDVYVEQGYMKPSPTGLRVTKFHALPTTTTLVAKFRGQVVGTISIIRDTAFGLPLDDVFDLQVLRQRYTQVAEISSLAIQRKFRVEHGKLLWPLLKFFFHYSKHTVRLEAILIGVHPRWSDFYVGILGFQALRAASVSEYDFANGNPVEGLFLDLETAPGRYAQMYAKRSGDGDVHHFFTSRCAANFTLPCRDYYKISDSVMTPQLLEYFFVQKTQTLDSMSESEILLLVNAYPEHRFRHLLQHRVRHSNRRRSSEARSKVSCHAIFAGVSQPRRSAEVTNVSRTGLGIRGDAPDGLALLKVQIADSEFVELQVERAWSREGRSGLRIIESSLAWHHFLRYLSQDFEIARDALPVAI